MKAFCWLRWSSPDLKPEDWNSQTQIVKSSQMKTGAGRMTHYFVWINPPLLPELRPLCGSYLLQVLAVQQMWFPGLEAVLPVTFLQTFAWREIRFPSRAPRPLCRHFPSNEPSRPLSPAPNTGGDSVPTRALNSKPMTSRHITSLRISGDDLQNKMLFLFLQNKINKDKENYIKNYT